MKIQSPPGMRDFYPEDMRVQNWLFDAWRRTSRAFGFSEYEGPIFEYLDLYTLKSGEGIVSELFTFQDRGQRNFAIRPEMTPTLARMVAARANALPRPIKWFSIPRMCRAERPQRGRLREFYQWNVDILGIDDPLADAEVIAVAAAFFADVGLTPADVVIRVSSRPMATAALKRLNVPDDGVETAFQLIDRAERMPEPEFRDQWSRQFPQAASGEQILRILAQQRLEECLELARDAGSAGKLAADQITELWEHLRELDVADFCAFDLRVVRGLAYYTGVVFEAHPRQGGLRALLGGGRYDDLTGLLDGPRVPGVGFGMGDAPVLDFLRQAGRLPKPAETIDVFLIDADAKLRPELLKLATRLRRQGLAVDFSYRRQPVAKQFKQAAARGARYALVVGDELATRGELTAKNLATGEQRGLDAGRLSADAHNLLNF